MQKSEIVKLKIQDSSTQLPISLKLQIIEETLPIIKAISDRYSRVLGENHYIAQSNKSYCEEISKRINGYKGWEDLCNDVEIDIESDDDEEDSNNFVGNLGRRISHVFTASFEQRGSHSGTSNRSGSKSHSISSHR